MKSDKQRTLAVIVGAALVSLAASYALFSLSLGVFEAWNSRVVDQLFVYRSHSARFGVPYHTNVVHVDITDETYRRQQDFYLNRSHFAQTISNLVAMQVAVQAWDFVFVERMTPVEDEAMVRATIQAGNVLYGVAFRLRQGDPKPITVSTDRSRCLDQTSWSVDARGQLGGLFAGTPTMMTFPDLALASRGLGHLTLSADPDGVDRRVPLLIRYGDAFYPSLALKVVCLYLQVPPEKILMEIGKRILLRGATPPRGPPRDIAIPIDRQGQMIVNYIGSREAMWRLDLADINAAAGDRHLLDLLRENLSGKIVVVSDVSTGKADLGSVPTDREYPLSGLHANAINTILTGSFLREASGWQMLLVEILIMGCLVLLAARFSSVPFTAGALALLAGYLFVAAMLFLGANVILNFLRPAMSVGLALLAILAYRYLNEEKQKEALRHSFEAYFPPTIVKKIMNQPSLITEGGQKKELTLLFSDIKDFTTRSAAMPPDEIRKMLNEYFDAMVEIVFKYEGTLDKFIGDGMMVFFGDPEPQPDHAVRCVRTAIEMQRKMRELRPQWEAEGKKPIEIRIGINTGSVVVGNMGSARRLSYTALGSAVNLAARLESNAPVGGILISENTYDQVKGRVRTRPLPRIQVKGFAEPIEVHEVLLDSSGLDSSGLGKGEDR